MPSSSLASLAVLGLLALSPLITARPAPTGTQQAKRSFQTPSLDLPPPQYLEDAAVRSAIANMAAAAQASAAVKARRSGLDNIVDVDIQKRGNKVDGDSLLKRAACVDSTADDMLISSLFHYGGAGTVVELCPGATIKLTNPVHFTAADQVLTTQGSPTGDTRATLVVTGQDQACAIFGACQGCDNIVVESIQVAGQRDVLGFNNGPALLELGGDNVGQTVKNCKLWEPRGWSALHGIEGNGNSCSSMLITGNQVGPCGHSPTNGKQFKRDDQVYVPEQWADGISLACKGSRVQGNTIVDATDGGIVIFGAPGSVVSGNTIIARQRRPLGGINLVDYSPFSGSFEGTVVENNVILADTNMIKAGIALGGMVWGSDNRTAARTWGGIVRNNVFKSGSGGYFGYAVAVAGHQKAMISGNDASGAAFGGGPSEACVPNPMVPSSQAFVYDHWTTTGSTLQDNFYNAPLVFLICQGPGPVVGTGVAKAQTGMITVGRGDLLGVVAPAPAAAAPSSSDAAVASTSAAAASSATSTSTSTDPTTATSTSVDQSPLAHLRAVLEQLAHALVPRRLDASSSTTTKSTRSYTKYKLHTHAHKSRSSTSSAAESTAAVEPSGAASLRSTWGRVIAALPFAHKPQASKRSPVEAAAAAADAPTAVVAPGWSKPTPVVNFVNPFDILDKHERLA
ncbi:hypothetical protein JCM3775_007375 [Rhodotorula graminis]